MKNFYTLLCLLAVSSGSLFAQPYTSPVNEPDLTKTKVFTSLPTKIPVSIETLTAMVDGEYGTTVNIMAAKGESKSLEGNIISTTSKYQNTLKTVLIQSDSYDGANITLTRTIDSTGLVVFRGRIISMKHADLYELKNEGNEYFFMKKNFYDLINE